MSRIFLAAWLAIGLANAQAQPSGSPPCRGDKILNAAGLLITLRSGQAYNAYPGSQALMSMWEPLDKVTVCGIGGSAVQITDLSHKNETVKAFRAYPQNTGSLI